MDIGFSIVYLKASFMINLFLCISDSVLQEFVIRSR